MDVSDKLLDRVQALINKANATEFSAEREAFLAKADALMFQYNIDQAMLAARTNGKGPQNLNNVTHEEMPWVDPYDEFFDIHSAIQSYLGGLTGVMNVRIGGALDVFGYPQDIRYFRQLWMSVYLTFSSKLNPRWDRALSDGENIKVLAESGEKWVPMWRMAQEAGSLLDVPCPPADNGKMKRLYDRACREAGTERMKLTHAKRNYRDSFAIGYRDVIFERTLRLKRERDRMESEAGDGVSLVLRKNATAVEDLMNEVYPNLVSVRGRGTRRQATSATAQAMGATAGRNVDLAGSGNVGAGRTTRGAIGG